MGRSGQNISRTTNTYRRTVNCVHLREETEVPVNRAEENRAIMHVAWGGAMRKRSAYIQ